MYFDADNYHLPVNIQKMQNGEPLNDEDRQPWLNRLADEIHRWAQGNGAVLACSALKEEYRELLNSKAENIQWIFLDGNKDLVRERITGRTGHFFDKSLLDSQFIDLEVPDYATCFSIEQSPEQIIDDIIKQATHE